MTNDFTFEWVEKITTFIRDRYKSSIIFIDIYNGQFIGSDQIITIKYVREIKDVKGYRKVPNCVIRGVDDKSASKKKKK